MTTIEYREKKHSNSSEIAYRYSIAHLKYDHGYHKNFCHIFGPPWLWLLPIKPPGDSLGYNGTYANPSLLTSIVSGKNIE